MKNLISFSSQSIPRRNTRNSHQFLIPIDSQTKYTKILINFLSQLIPRRKISSVSHPNRFPGEIRKNSHQFLIPIDSQTKNLISFSSQSIPRRNTQNSHQFLIPIDSQTKYTKILINFLFQLIPR